MNMAERFLMADKIEGRISLLSHDDVFGPNSTEGFKYPPFKKLKPVGYSQKRISMKRDALKAAGWDKPLTQKQLDAVNWPGFDSFESIRKKTVEELAEKYARDFDQLLISVLPFPFSEKEFVKRCQLVRQAHPPNSPTHFVVDGKVRLIFWDMQHRSVINPATGQEEIIIWRPYKILED